MSRRPTFLAKQFSADCVTLESTAHKVEGLFGQGQLSRDDVNAVYAGLFLDGFTGFESLVERLFLGLFDGSLKSKHQPVARLFRVVPSAHSKLAVFEGSSYLDWLPIEDRAIPRAKRFFQQGLPFSGLQTSEKQALKHAHLLRNALAHKSDAATTKFLASINQQALLPHEKTPAGYLRSLPQGPTGPTQFSLVLRALQAASNRLCL